MPGYENKKIHMVMPVWGKDYIDVLNRIFLPALLAPGNLPAFCSRHDTLLKIYTMPEDVPRLTSSPAYSRLSELTEIFINYIDDVDLNSFDVKVDGINIMIEAHRRALIAAQNKDCGLLILHPDLLIADGSLEALSDIIKTDPRAVITSAVRGTRETLIPVLEKRAAQSNSVDLPISRRELAAYFIEHIHPFFKACTWKSGNFNRYWPNCLIWDVGDEGVVLRDWHPLPIYLDLPVKGIFPRRTIDFLYLAHVFPDFSGVHVVRDSDIMMTCAPTELDHFKGTPFHTFPPYKGRVSDVTAWGARASDWFHIECFKNKVRIHPGEMSDAWERVEKDSDGTVAAILDMLSPWNATRKTYFKIDEPGGIDTARLPAFKQSFLSNPHPGAVIIEQPASAGADPGKIMDTALALEKLGLFGEAMELLEKIPAGVDDANISVKLKMISRNRKRGEDALHGNFEKNMAALSVTFPELRKLVMSSAPDKYIVGGDTRGGWRILRKSISGGGDAAIDDATLPGRDTAAIQSSLAGMLDRIKSGGAALMSGFLLCDVIVWLLDTMDTIDPDGAFMLYVVEADPEIFRSILFTHDLSSFIARKKLVPFIGGDYERKVKEWFNGDRFRRYPAYNIILSEEIRSRLASFTPENPLTAQDALNTLANIESHYTSIPDSMWKEKFEKKDLKILIVANKRHDSAGRAADRTAAAVERLGCRAVSGVEKDAFRAETIFYMLAMVAETKPDMVIGINRLRYGSESVFPLELPFVSILLDPTVAAGFDPDLCDPLNFVLAPCREGAPCAAGVHPIPPGVADEIARTDGLDEPGGEAENAFTELVKLAIEVIREKFNSPRGTL